ncbi:BON domain-containing protein [Plantactinospora veratri]
MDDRNRLMGIVTRSDLLKVHDRLDAVIRDEVTQRVLRRGLMIPAGDVRAEVDDGLVTLTGRTGRRTTAMAAVAMTAMVPGVTDVVDLISYDADDTSPAPEPPNPDASPAGWRPGAAIPINQSYRLRRPGFDHNVAAYGASGGSKTRR